MLVLACCPISTKPLPEPVLTSHPRTLLSTPEEHFITFLYPHSTKLKSVCPSIRPSVCPSVDRIVSALYLLKYSLDPFHIYTSYPATSEGVLHVTFCSKLKNLKFCNLDFVLFWLGIQYELVMWVIMGWGVYPQNKGILVVIVGIILPF